MQTKGQSDCVYQNGTLRNSISLGLSANAVHLKSTETLGHILFLLLHRQFIQCWDNCYTQRS